MFNKIIIENGGDDDNSLSIEDGAAVQMDILHSLIHDGYLHVIDLYKTAQNTTDVTNISFTVPATESDSKKAGLHSRFDIQVSGGVKIELLSLTGYTLGTAANINTLNNNYANNLKSTFVTDATLDTPVVRESQLSGSNSGGAVRSAAAFSEIPERVLKPGKYAYRITPIVNGTIFNVDFYVYERHL